VEKNIPLALKKISRANRMISGDRWNFTSLSGYPDEEIEIAVSQDDPLAYDLYREVAAAVAKRIYFLPEELCKKQLQKIIYCRANNHPWPWRY
jgi:hypothetical protein